MGWLRQGRGSGSKERERQGMKMGRKRYDFLGFCCGRGREGEDVFWCGVTVGVGDESVAVEGRSNNSDQTREAGGADKKL